MSELGHALLKHSDHMVRVDQQQAGEGLLHEDSPLLHAIVAQLEHPALTDQTERIPNHIHTDYDPSCR